MLGCQVLGFQWRSLAAEVPLHASQWLSLRQDACIPAVPPSRGPPREGAGVALSHASFRVHLLKGPEDFGLSCMMEAIWVRIVEASASEVWGRDRSQTEVPLHLEISVSVRVARAGDTKLREVLP